MNKKNISKPLNLNTEYQTYTTNILNEDIALGALRASRHIVFISENKIDDTTIRAAAGNYFEFNNKNNHLSISASGAIATFNLLGGDDSINFASTQKGGNYTIQGGTGNDKMFFSVSNAPQAQAFTAHIDGGSKNGQQDKVFISEIKTFTFQNHKNHFTIKSGNSTFNIKNGSVKDIHLNMSNGMQLTFSWNKTSKTYEFMGNAAAQNRGLLTSI